MDDARRDAAAFLPRAREVADPQTLIPALAQAAFSCAAAGELDEAVALAEEFARIDVYSPGGFNYPVLPTLLRICVAAGELRIAESLLDGAAQPGDSPLLLHSTTAGRAILADAGGERERAAALYREAAEGWADWGSLIERAYALLGLGRCGDVDGAREAAAIFERIGARPVLARAA